MRLTHKIAFVASVLILAGVAVRAQNYNSGTGADGWLNTSLAFFTSAGDATLRLPASAQYAFNGTTWDRMRNAALAVFPASSTTTARNSIGAQIAEKGSRWTVVSNPAASSQASASLAAEASVRHVADCITFSAGATTAPALTALTVTLRDGAAGAGTVLWTHQVVIPASTGQSVAPHSVCGLNLVGTTNTAMTLEFSALLLNLAEAVSLSGFNVN